MRRPEIVFRIVVIVVLALAVGVPLTFWWRTPIVHARMPEAGGWNPDALQAAVGVPLRLRLTSDDVVHGFAVGKLDLPAVDILPGRVTEVTLTFSDPGTYTFYCTRWCGLNHWRMRGIIEVSGASGVEASAQPPEVPPYVSLGIDLDAPRRAPVVPSSRPTAALADDQLMAELATYSSTASYRSLSPYEAWQAMRADTAFSHVEDRALWDNVATIWRTNTTAGGLEEGRRLFSQNCAACHGGAASGDGVFAHDLEAGMLQDSVSGTGMLQAPANLADPARMLAASPALIHGKILRGGMGTGMPSWGPIFTDEQVWNLAAYIYSLQFEYSQAMEAR